MSSKFGSLDICLLLHVVRLAGCLKHCNLSLEQAMYLLWGMNQLVTPVS